MAREVQLFSVTIPAGTLPGAPQTTPMRMPARVVEEIEVLIPPGPRGEVGFRIGSSGVQLLPIQLGAWIVTDDEVIHWPLENQHDSGSWELVGYNTGIFAHTITVRFLVRLVGDQVQGAAAAIPADALGAVPGADAGLNPPALPPLPALPPGALPTPAELMPPILPVAALPGQILLSSKFSSRATVDLTAFYGGQLRVFHVDNVGVMRVLRFARAWEPEQLSWATGLMPGAPIAGGLWGGLAHVFAPLQAGGVLHLAQPAEGGDASSWGGEVLGAP